MVGVVEVYRLVLLSGHSTGSESPASAAETSAEGQDEGTESGNGEPVGVSEGGLETGVPHPVLNDVPENHVNDKDDEGDDGTNEGEDRHENGGQSRGGSDTNQTHDKGDQGEEAGNWVKNEDVGKVVQSGRVGVDTVSTGNNQIITNIPRCACTSSHTSTKDTEDGLLTSGVGNEEVDLVPCWRRDRSEKQERHCGECEEQSWKSWGRHFGCVCYAGELLNWERVGNTGE